VRFDKKIFKLINKFKTPVNWYNLIRLEPTSRVFRFEKGAPINRVYTEHFLNLNKQLRNKEFRLCTTKSYNRCLLP
jgi:hypothetical protein